jgi:hypothetical protein
MACGIRKKSHKNATIRGNNPVNAGDRAGCSAWHRLPKAAKFCEDRHVRNLAAFENIREKSGWGAGQGAHSPTMIALLGAPPAMTEDRNILVRRLRRALHRVGE